MNWEKVSLAVFFFFAAAAAGAEAVSGAATDGAITDTEARDGGEDAGAGVGATAAE